VHSLSNLGNGKSAKADGLSKTFLQSRAPIESKKKCRGGAEVLVLDASEGQTGEGAAKGKCVDHHPMMAPDGKPKGK
jgi:hypothetical protein